MRVCTDARCTLRARTQPVMPFGRSGSSTCSHVARHGNRSARRGCRARSARRSRSRRPKRANGPRPGERNAVSGRSTTAAQATSAEPTGAHGAGGAAMDERLLRSRDAVLAPPAQPRRERPPERSPHRYDESPFLTFPSDGRLITLRMEMALPLRILGYPTGIGRSAPTSSCSGPGCPTSSSDRSAAGARGCCPRSRSTAPRRSATRAAGGDRPRRDAARRRDARSAWAAIVSEGFAPRFALTAAPSTTWRPGSVHTRCQPSSTPSAGRGPDRRAAEDVGRERAVQQDLVQAEPGRPPIASAAWRAASFASGIQVGAGSRPPARSGAAGRSSGAGARCRCACITSRITVRSAHRRGMCACTA